MTITDRRPSSTGRSAKQCKQQGVKNRQNYTEEQGGKKAAHLEPFHNFTRQHQHPCIDHQNKQAQGQDGEGKGQYQYKGSDQHIDYSQNESHTKGCKKVSHLIPRKKSEPINTAAVLMRS